VKKRTGDPLDCRRLIESPHQRKPQQRFRKWGAEGLGGSELMTSSNLVGGPLFHHACCTRRVFATFFR
jgi:hypothetical protein